MKKKNGFTLIELLIIIVILGTISGIAIYFSSGAINKSKEKTYVTTRNNITSSAIDYLKENNINFIYSDEDEEYQCVTIKDLINSGYFDKNIKKSKLDENISVTDDTNIYVVRNSTTKVIVLSKIDDEEKCTKSHRNNEIPSIPTYISTYDDGSGTYKSGTWTNKKVNITISSIYNDNDDISIQYATNKMANSWNNLDLNLIKNGDTWSGTKLLDLKERNDTYYFRACDNNGNCSEPSNAFNIRYDLTSPETNISANSYKSFTWIASDQNEIGGIIISNQPTIPDINSEDWKMPNEFSVDINTTNKLTYYVWAKDTAGNISEVKSITNYAISKSIANGTNLIISDETTEENIPFPENNTIYVVSGTRIKVTGNLLDGYNSLVITKETEVIDNNTTYTVDSDMTFNISATPILSCTIGSNHSTDYGDDVTLTINTTGNSDGISYSWDNGNTYGTSNTKTYKSSGTINVKVKNSAGNEASCNITISSSSETKYHICYTYFKYCTGSDNKLYDKYNEKKASCKYGSPGICTADMCMCRDSEVGDAAWSYVNECTENSKYRCFTSGSKISPKTKTITAYTTMIR